MLEIHITPSQCQGFRWHANAAVTRQSDQQPPLGIRSRIHQFVSLFPSNEALASLICPDGDSQISERVWPRHHASLNAPTEKFTTASKMPAISCFGESFLNHESPERLGIGSSNAIGVLLLVEEFQQPPFELVKVHPSMQFHVAFGGNEAVRKFAEGKNDRCCPRHRQTRGGKPAMESIVNAANPVCSFRVGGRVHGFSRDQFLNSQIDTLGGTPIHVPQPNTSAPTVCADSKINPPRFTGFEEACHDGYSVLFGASMIPLID